VFRVEGAGSEDFGQEGGPGGVEGCEALLEEWARVGGGAA
jgi:hypothetical protein